MSRYQELVESSRFPIGFWNYCGLDTLGPDAVKDWVDAGMTVAQTPRFNAEKDNPADMIAILDACEEAGIKAIVCDSRCGFGWNAEDGRETDRFRKRFSEAVKEFGSHPAVFGFHAGDEPHGKESSLSAFHTYAIQKELAPGLTPFQNLGPYGPGTTAWVGYDDYDRFMRDYISIAHPEFICFDVYWQMEPEEEGREKYFACLNKFAEHAFPAGIRLWVTLLSVGHFRYRCPDEDLLRWQLNTAVAHGCTGVAWFFMYMREPHDNYRIAPIDEHWERTETFEWLSRVNRTFQQLHGSVVSDLALQNVRHFEKVYGKTPSFEKGKGLLTKVRDPHPLIISEYKDSQGRDYVGVTNSSQTDSAHVVLSWRDSPDLYRVAWNGKEAKEKLYPADEEYPHDARIGPWLAPGQLELWRLDYGK